MNCLLFHGSEWEFLTKLNNLFFLSHLRFLSLTLQFIYNIHSSFPFCLLFCVCLSSEAKHFYFHSHRQLIENYNHANIRISYQQSMIHFIYTNNRRRHQLQTTLEFILLNRINHDDTWGLFVHGIEHFNRLLWFI